MNSKRKQFKELYCNDNSVSGFLASQSGGSLITTNDSKYLNKNNYSTTEGLLTKRELLQQYLLDAINVRGEEVLNKKCITIDKLIALAIKTIPQEINSNVNANVSFLDAITKASVELDKLQDVDIEGVTEARPPR